ncbi:unnamed protein product [marine sediment metagenome]|uniref:Lipoprotein n=1 Tax=marine sediment metagenome TaxID=412755 RepID=X0Z3M6_9ZZZZ
MRILLATLFTLTLGCTSPPTSPAPGAWQQYESYQIQPYQPRRDNRYEAQQTYRQQRQQEQILQHGYGGCAPNFSTGGCL